MGRRRALTQKRIARNSGRRSATAGSGSTELEPVGNAKRDLVPEDRAAASPTPPSTQFDELAARMDRLEKALSSALRPLEAMGDIGERYLRIASLLLENGGLAPDTLFPEVKDAISRDILSALMRLREANISRLTDHLRSKRGKASRRIVRDRLAALEKQGLVETETRGRRPVYVLTERVVKKWSSIFVPEK